MGTEPAEQGPRQRLGRRLSPTAYYTVVERSERRLRLESRPGANRGPGRRIMLAGIALLALAVLLIGSGVYAAGSGVGFGAVALGAVLGGLLGAFGYQRALGGYAVLTTYNHILADRDQAALVFTQGNKVAPERTQRLPFARIGALRLRRRPLGREQVVALELVVSGDEIWIVDSASDVEELRATAEGLSAVLGRELARG